jgi:hypothetical protein
MAPGVPSLIQKAKAAAKKKHVEVKGSTWKAEVVKDEDGQFQDFSHWKQQYEPQKEKKEKKEDSAFKKQQKAKVAAKAKSKVLDRLTTGISTKLVQIILEVTSKLLEKVEHESHGKNQEISSLANNFKGLVLTFRFSKKKTEAQFRYLRQLGCARLATLLQAMQVDSNWVDIQSQLTSHIRNSQSEVKSITLTLLADTVGSANSRAEEFAESKLPEIEQGVAMASLGAEKITGKKTPVVPLDLQKKDEVKALKDNQVNQFIIFLQDMIVSKMDPLMNELTLAINDIFGKIGQVVKNLDDASAEIDEGTQEELSGQVESVHLNLVDAVEMKVKDMMTVLEGMMDTSGEEDDDANGEE